MMRLKRMVWLGAMALVLSPIVARAQQAADCRACHGVEGFASESGKKLYLKESAFKASVHGSLACVACHTDARSIPHAPRLKKVSCATCHSQVNSDITAGAHKALVRGKETASACIACHGAHEVSPPKQKPVALCATCHASQATTYEKSVHGQGLRRGESDVASCEECHGPAHKLRPANDPASSVYKSNLPRTCGTCHANPELVAKYHIPMAKPLEAYQNSVHGQAMQAGREGAARCSDCHGSHGLFAAADPRSQVFRANVPATCGRCHADIWQTFRTSIHGQAVARGVTGAPVCTDCHGEHNILAPAEPGSTVSAAGIRVTCARCHADERLVAKYGLPRDKVPAYEDTYHGLAARAGSVSVANCASCHGVHDIRPSSDPLSRINKRNLAATCGKCHPDAGTRFALGPVHVVATPTSSRAVYWVRWFYLWLIIGTIGGMVLHNLADFLRKLISGYEVHHGRPIERMGLNFRLQHGLVTVSFVMLVLTGFALKYPESWWAAPLLRWEAQHAVRGTLHRIFAVVLIGAFVYHVIFLAVDRKARRCLRAILPARQDMYDFIAQVRFNLGLAREKPLYAKFNYIEKSEYWALVWGTAVMTISGFLLWFENFTLRNFPSWVADVATAVHFYEAILAGLAILVWHFYFTIFDPEVYPMEKSWLTGKVSGPRWERLNAQGESETSGVVPDAKESGSRPRHAGMLLVLLPGLLFAPWLTQPAAGARASPGAEENEACLACHSDKGLTTKRARRTVALFVDAKRFSSSVHGALSCTSCHADLEGKELPHSTPLARVTCGACHTQEQQQHTRSLHGKAIARGDPLAPHCVDCHGNHDILPVKDPRSAVAPLKVPFVCGGCHQEGTPVQVSRPIHQDHILENYSESIHGEGLLKRGLVVAPTCASCHTAHFILPHTDPASSIARRNIAATCTRCHAQIEPVHRKVIKGELWEKEARVLPACVDCHQPHKVRKVFYTQGMADADCVRCHTDARIKASRDSRSLTVRAEELARSRHAKTACSQCHSEVNASRVRPCETITKKVDCASCHAEIGQQYQRSTHGQLLAKNDPNAPTCKECHGTHSVLGRHDPQSLTFATNIPKLCARCHREGKKAAVRYTGPQHEIIEHYTESIHGKGLLKSGLTVTATCTSCHTAHRVLPRTDSESTVNSKNVPATCGRCHHGIQERFLQSVHVTSAAKTNKELPICSDCHSAHTIRRTDQDPFKLDIMTKCGRCHEEIAKTYFDTYHGKVSRLGYTKTAKCYDCHGAHDVQSMADPRSHLSRANVVATCQKCHPGATRRFAGYLTHATHHDPKKYPFLFWAFWGMTTLLVGTFLISGIHTLLWLPRAIQMRRELQAEEAAKEQEARREASSKQLAPPAAEEAGDAQQ